MPILLSACVNPNGMTHTALQDTQERMNQYKRAILWYIEHTDQPIVVVENSNTDMSAEFADFIKEGRLEYIFFDGNNYPHELGKGLGEALIIKYALDNSYILKSYDSFIKITGRLILNNFNDIIRKIEPEVIYSNTIFIDGKGVNFSHVFIANRNFILNYFLPYIDKLDDSKGFYFEHLLFEAISKWERNGGNHSEFFHELKVTGRRGTNNEYYYSSSHFGALKSVAKYYLHRWGLFRNHRLSD